MNVNKIETEVGFTAKVHSFYLPFFRSSGPYLAFRAPATMASPASTIAPLPLCSLEYAILSSLFIIFSFDGFLRILETLFDILDELWLADLNSWPHIVDMLKKGFCMRFHCGVDVSTSID